MEELKVLLADNQELFREGLAKLLESQPQIEVVCQCDNALEAVAEAKVSKPDLVLMNADMPACDGIEAMKHISESLPNTKLAMLTDSEDEEKALSALEAGAKGYLLKNIGIDSLVESIGLIAKGHVVVSPPLDGKLANELAAARKQKEIMKAESDTSLSERETDIVKLVVEGATNKEIAARLVITENTAKVHVKNILEKLQVRNKQQLAAYAVQKWLVNSTEDEDTGEEQG